MALVNGEVSSTRNGGRTSRLDSRSGSSRGRVKNDPFKSGSDGRQESFSRRDFHSFLPLVAGIRGENE